MSINCVTSALYCTEFKPMDNDDDVPFFCLECDFLSKNITLLKEHRQEHLATIAKKSHIKCVHCNNNFSSNSKLKNHVENIHDGVRHICDKCGKSYTTKQELRRHTLVVHDMVKTKRAKKQCAECSSIFVKSYTNCVQHTATCEKCGYVTKYSSRLKVHQARSYCDPKKLRKSIPCPKCTEKFTTVKYMKKHEEVHTLGKRHKCVKCGNCFTEKFNMKRHMKSKYCKSPNGIDVKEPEQNISN